MSILLPTNLQQCPSPSLSPSTPLLSPSPSSASAVSFLGTRRRCLRFVTSSVASLQSSVAIGSAPAPAAVVVERDQIRLGLPSKGRMAADAIDLLKDCQLSVKQVNPRQYVAQIPQLPNTEVWFQRPKDIVRKLLSGDLDLGIVGLDTLSEYGQGNEDLIVVHEALNFGDCHLSIAIPNYGIFENINSLKELAQMPQWSEERPLRVATGFTYLGPKFMKENGIKHVAFSTADGALEAAPAVRLLYLHLSHCSQLFYELHIKGIIPFIDGEVKRGESVGPVLVGAIRQSRVAIVLVSRNYTSSSWCLDELVEIMKCREVYQQTVMTIFNEVDPSDVRKQTGDFGKAFDETCVGKTEEVKQAWRQALKSLQIVVLKSLLGKLLGLLVTFL